MLRVPEARPLPGGEPLGFHPKSLERGLRSERGLEVTNPITSDDHAGLRAARRAVFAKLPWQRCKLHLQQNAQAHVPNFAMRPQVARDLRSVFT